jgi:uncharacterized protein YheU (UPF0270 family)
MSQSEVIIEYDRQAGHPEDGVIVPLDRINTETLRKLVEEFVTREWSELTDAGCTFEGKIEQVLQQLIEGKAHVVFDLLSETCNIAPTDMIRKV